MKTRPLVSKNAFRGDTIFTCYRMELHTHKESERSGLKCKSYSKCAFRVITTHQSRMNIFVHHI